MSDNHSKSHDTGPELLKSALYYAQKKHWPVFPLKPKAKTPITPNGFKDASTQIRTWWGKWSKANIGIPTGIHFWALDVFMPAKSRPTGSVIAIGAFFARISNATWRAVPTGARHDQKHESRRAEAAACELIERKCWETCLVYTTTTKTTKYSPT